MIRNVRMDDLPQLLEIEAQAAPKSRWGGADLVALMIRYRSTFLVHAGDGVEGYIVFRPDGHLLSLAVLPARRRKGIGSQLVAEAARACGLLPLVIEVRVGNRVARSFYLSLGFHEVRRESGYYPEGEDAIVMEKPAGPAKPC